MRSLDIGATGMKTGHTEAGGYGMIGTGKDGDRETIIVVNGLKTSQDRAQEAARLLEWSLRRFSTETLIKADQSIAQASVKFAKNPQSPVGMLSDVSVSVPLRRLDEVKTEIKIQDNLVAPIAKGTKIGTITINIPGQEALVYPAVALDDIKEKGFIGKTIEKLSGLVSGGQS